MWPFRQKKIVQENYAGPPCPYCKSTMTKLILYHGTSNLNYVKVWRGQRSFTYRCDDCGQDFYGAELKQRITNEYIRDDDVIDDEAALRAAEEEVKRQGEED